MTELILDLPCPPTRSGVPSRVRASSDMPTCFSSWIADWLRGNLRQARVSDRMADGRPIERDLAHLEIRTKAPIEKEALLTLRYVLHVQRECFQVVDGFWKRDDFKLQLACEPIAAERLADGVWRVHLKIRNAPTIRDLAEAWNLILEETDASGRSWSDDVKRVVFYHPRAPATKHSAPNRNYCPPKDIKVGQVLARLPDMGPTEIIDVDEAFADMARVSDDEAFEAMEAARRAEKARAAAS